jgi:nucleoside phosphorylase/DNA-binding NarL/FixJ family response regulator
MKVLIVHDRRSVGEQIEAIVSEVCPAAITARADDGISARDRLTSDHYDLCILDLTLPNVSGRSPVGFQVVEALLEEMLISTSMLVPGSILGITRDADALNRIQNNVGQHLMAIVEERDDKNWIKQLSDRIEYVRNSTSARANALLTKYDFDALILTALDKELAPYHELFELTNHPRFDGLSQFTFVDGKQKVRKGACFAIGRAGQASAASEAQGLLCQLRPRIAIMTGFCGGIPGKAELGDILFAEMAIDWDYGKWKPHETMARLYSRPEPINIRNSRTHRIARSFVENGAYDGETLRGAVARLSEGEVLQPNIKLSPFASGSAVIGDYNVVTEIQTLHDNIGAVDMESYGFYYACEYPHAAKPEFICVKSVADDCGPDKSDRLHRSCSFSSAFIAKEILTKAWEF